MMADSNNKSGQETHAYDADHLLIEVDHALSFLFQLYGEDASGSLPLFGLPSKQVWWLDPTDEEGMTRCLQDAGQQNLYFPTCLHSRAHAEALWQKAHPGVPFAGRGVHESAVCVPGVFGDFDVHGAAHRNERLPRSKDEILTWLATYPLRPSLVWDSGNGIQAAWLFREPWALESDEERQEAIRFRKLFHDAVQAHAGARWKFDNVADLARVLRLPGSWNWKQSPPLPVVLLEDSGLRYNSSDFEDYFPRQSTKKKKQERTDKRSDPQRLAEAREALKCIPAVEYQTWIDMGMALHSEDSGPIGLGIFIEWSATSTTGEFSELECKKKWNSFHDDREDKITLNSLFALAMEHGWRPTGERADEERHGEPPRLLKRKVPPPESYPLGAPALVFSKTIQAPLAICGQSLLGAVALAVQPHCNIMLDGRTIPLCENFITIGESGERKTATDNEALRAHRAHEKGLCDQYLLASPDYENDLLAYQKAKDEAVRKAKTRAEKKAALDALGPPPQAPLFPLFITEEPTYEGLIKLLQRGRPSLGLFSDEGGRMIGGHAMSEEQLLKTITGLCELWDGKRISRVRAGDGAALLYGRRVSTHLMVQPPIAMRLFHNSTIVSQGYLSRCQTVWPESTMGTRPYKPVDLSTNETLNAYWNRITSILKAPLPLAEGKANELAPRPLLLSPDAKALWIKFHDLVEEQLADTQPFALIRGLANKAPEHALRDARILTLYEDLNAPNIPVTHMGNAIKLEQYYLSEALRLYQASATDPDLELAERLLA